MRTAPLGPVEDLAAMIDKTAAMATGRRALTAPAQVVERAALDPQELGRLVDGKKGRVVILEHERGLRSFRGPVSPISEGVGEVQRAGSPV